MCACLRGFVPRLPEAWAPRVNRTGEDGGATSLVGGRLSRSVEAKGKGKEEGRRRPSASCGKPPLASSAASTGAGGGQKRKCHDHAHSENVAGGKYGASGGRCHCSKRRLVV